MAPREFGLEGGDSPFELMALTVAFTKSPF